MPQISSATGVETYLYSMINAGNFASTLTSSEEDQGYSAGPPVVVESLGERGPPGAKLLFKPKTQHGEPAQAGVGGLCLEEQSES